MQSAGRRGRKSYSYFPVHSAKITKEPACYCRYICTMFYFVKTPALLRKMYSSMLWKVNTEEKILYLTFDDGPHPTATPFILDQLKEYDAKATFFCLGKKGKW